MLLGTLENLWEGQKIKKDGVFTLELQMSISTSRKTQDYRKTPGYDMTSSKFI